MTDLDLYLIEDAAPRLRVSPDYYRAQLRRRAWPGHKIAGRWMVTEADIQGALDLCAVAAAPDPPPTNGLTRRSAQRLARPTTTRKAG